MRSGGAGIAPVTVQRLVDADPRGTQRIEQVGGCPQHQFRNHDLGLGRFNFGVDIGLAFGFGIVGKTRKVSALQRFGRAQGGRFGGVDLCRDLPHHLLYLRVAVGGIGRTLAEHALAGAHFMGHIALHGTTNPGQNCQQDQLIKRGLVFEAGFERDHLLGAQRYLDIQRRAAAGGALAKAVPVIAVADARVAGVDDGNHIGAVVRALRVDVHPVGKNAAGAVILGAVEHKILAFRAHFGDDLADFNRADFGPAVAHQIPRHKARKPGISRRAWRSIETVFDKGKMATQRLHNVRVGLSQFDQQLEQLAD